MSSFRAARRAATTIRTEPTRSRRRRRSRREPARLLTFRRIQRNVRVLAGHSVGGTYLLAYAMDYPKEVAGVALIDSVAPHQFDLPTFP